VSAHPPGGPAPLWLTIPLALLLARALGVASAVMARGVLAGTLTRKSWMGVHSPAATASDEASALARPLVLVFGLASSAIVVAPLA